MISVVQNPALKQFQGKRLSEVAKAWNQDPMDTLFDLLIEDKAFTDCAVFGMSEPDVALALQQPWVSIDNDSSANLARGHSRRGTPASASLWDISANPAEIRAGRKEAGARRSHP